MKNIKTNKITILRQINEDRYVYLVLLERDFAFERINNLINVDVTTYLRETIKTGKELVEDMDQF